MARTKKLSDCYPCDFLRRKWEGEMVAQSIYQRVPIFHAKSTQHIDQFCALSNEHLKGSQHFTQHSDRMRNEWILKTFKGFIFYNTHVHPGGDFVVWACQTNTIGTRHGKNNRNAGLKGHRIMIETFQLFFNCRKQNYFCQYFQRW